MQIRRRTATVSINYKKKREIWEPEKFEREFKLRGIPQSMGRSDSRCYLTDHHKNQKSGSKPGARIEQAENSVCRK